jgi:peptide/nickel transport system substrate-binding protein
LQAGGIVGALGFLSACGSGDAATDDGAARASTADAGVADTSGDDDGSNAPLVVGCSSFSRRFSPFFAVTASYRDAQALTQLSLYPLTRLGEIVYKGIEGETFGYNGAEYTYTGPANIEVTQNPDGSVDYDITLRDDLTFSDGEKLSIDDLIFSIYVRCDPAYDGSSELCSMPIEGMQEYRDGMDTFNNLIAAAGRSNTDFGLWTEGQQQAYWVAADDAALALAQEIVDRCGHDGLVEEDDVVASAARWGYELDSDATLDDFAAALMEAHENNVAAAIVAESAGSSIEDLFPTYSEYQMAVQTGRSASSIKGIQKTGEYSLRIHATRVDVDLIRQLRMEIAPMHYYGSAKLYDYDGDQFGFSKGDLSRVRSKSSKPMGAGPYKFAKYKSGVIRYKANELYYKGEPKVKSLRLREVRDADKLDGVARGSIDVTNPPYSKGVTQAIANYNGGYSVGDVITTSAFGDTGYAYIGINARNVCVGSDPGSEASKNLRRALATMLAAYRSAAIGSYYGDAAKVINFPANEVSWAAPHAGDPDYRVAYSVDVNGYDIYATNMDSEARYVAAKEAALRFFKAAGYTLADGVLIAAPEGAKLSYEVMVPATGSGDHPLLQLFSEAKNAFEEIGLTLVVNDLLDVAAVRAKLDAVQGEIWCATWGAAKGPSMAQTYFSDVANKDASGAKHNPDGGPAQGDANFEYCIADIELDALVEEASNSTDQEYRRMLYKACLEIIDDWACEIPVYQRQNATIFSTERVDVGTIAPDITSCYGWTSEIESIRMRSHA